MEPYQKAISRARDRGLQCTCWDHLREFGITPPAALADKHRDIRGTIYNTHDGTQDRDRTKSLSQAQSEAEVVMKRGRGQNVD